MTLHKNIFYSLLGHQKTETPVYKIALSLLFKNNFWYHFCDDYRWGRAFVRLYMFVIDRNMANRPPLMLQRDDVNTEIYAPNMDAPQTGAYLALRHIY